MSNTGRKRGVRRGTRVVRKRVPRNRPKPNYLLLFWVFLVSAMISGSGSFALHTPSLVIKEVKISGVRLADRKIVEKTAKSALGQNILMLKKSPVISKINTLREVSEVKMGRTFPNKVWIRVWERKPAAVLTDNSKFFLVQDNGFMYHQVNGPQKGVPTLSVAGCGVIKAGLRSGSEDVKSGLEALRYAHRSKIRIVKISVDPDGDMCLNMGSGFYVNLGQSDDIAKKMSLLRSALACKPSLVREAAYIDISCPSAPVWKPRRAAS